MNLKLRVKEVRIQRFQGFGHLAKNIQKYNEEQKPKLMHQCLQRIFKLKKPSPLMQNIIDPLTDEIANETREYEILNQYLKEKFEGNIKKKILIYPKSMIPNMETIEQLYRNADLKKTTGYDFIPYEALQY